MAIAWSAPFLPMAPGLPIGRSRDFGTSPFLGNSRTSDGLNRALPYIVSDLLDTSEKKLPYARDHRAADAALDRRRGDRIRGCLLRCEGPQLAHSSGAAVTKYVRC